MINTQNFIKSLIEAFGVQTLPIYPDLTTAKTREEYAVLRISEAKEEIPANYTYRMEAFMDVYIRPDKYRDETAMDAIKYQFTEALRLALEKLYRGDIMMSDPDFAIMSYTLFPGSTGVDALGYKLSVPFSVVVQF